MPIANSKQTVGTDLVHGSRVAPTRASHLGWPKRHKCRRQTHNRNSLSAVLRGVRLTTLGVPCPAAGEISSGSDMGTEHVVGESVVVPGLKLTDHTFQVRCPLVVDHIKQGFAIACSPAVQAPTLLLLLHLCLKLTAKTGTLRSSQQANKHHQLVCARSNCSEQNRA